MGAVIAQLIARLVSGLGIYLCCVGSSPAGDIMIRLCVNGWHFPPRGGGFTEGIS